MEAASLRWLVLVAAVGLVVTSCSSDPESSEAYQTLDLELATAQQQLADVTVERDRLTDSIAIEESRAEKTKAGQAAITEIVADPSAFGGESEVLDLIMTHITADAVMDDDVFGPVPSRQAWRNTLFDGLDAQIHTWHRWVSDNGSHGLSLWTWSGTNFVGDPFELIGLSILDYDDGGKQQYQLVIYPYEDALVKSELGL